ncbi:MAG: RloB domain-containing protein [Clostridia bacterium]|nr:RloB domain-containing protein [Clostridia bacterium]
MADQLFKRRKSALLREKNKIQKNRSQRWLFVCEGSKTEPNYIKRLIEYYNQKSDEADIIVTAEGTGRNTVSLVESVDDFLDKTAEYRRNSLIPYEKIFVLFDKDSFGAENFNRAIALCESKGYIPIWSNECFELWYLLHFEYYQCDSGRQVYYEKLSERLGEEYDKADNIFDKIHSDESIKRAYHNARKLIEEQADEASAAKKIPCTQMPVLIDMLEEKLKIKIV